MASDRETFFQVSLLQGLTLGDYHGSVSVKELKRKGDIGLGTFDGLDGEMIMLDGSVYKAKGDGTVELADDSETIPFCGITFFDDDESWTVENIETHRNLRQTPCYFKQKSGRERGQQVLCSQDHGQVQPDERPQ